MRAIGTVGKGLAVGTAATAVMTAYQLAVQKARGEKSHSGVPRTWAEAPAPAQLAKKVLGRRVTKRQAPLLTQIGHWGYGLTWGVLYTALRPYTDASPLALGSALGAGLWALAYAEMAPLGVYDAPWRYPAKELGIDISYHLVYGLAAAYAYEALESIG